MVQRYGIGCKVAFLKKKIYTTWKVKANGAQLMANLFQTSLPSRGAAFVISLMNFPMTIPSIRVLVLATIKLKQTKTIFFYMSSDFLSVFSTTIISFFVLA